MAPNIDKNELDQSDNIGKISDYKILKSHSNKLTNWCVENKVFMAESCKINPSVKNTISQESTLEEDFYREVESDEFTEAGTIDHADDTTYLSTKNSPCSKIDTSQQDPPQQEELDYDKVCGNGLKEPLCKAYFVQHRPVTHDTNFLRPTVPIFTGDPHTYPKFEATFDTFIGSAPMNDCLKLNLLIQHCEGEARSCIEDFVLMSNDKGYGEARKVLKQWFGNSHNISHSMISKLINGPCISSHDGDALKLLSSEMKRCFLTLSYLNYQMALDDCHVLLKIMQRLPISMQEEWAWRVYEITEDGNEPDFDDLYKFVEKMAMISQSYFGRNLYAAKSTKDRCENVRDRTDVVCDRRGIVQCYYCKSNHRLENCTNFAALSITSKRKYMFKTHRCYNCLQRGHVAHGCLKDAKCDICNGRHHTWFHPLACMNASPSQVVDLKCDDKRKEVITVDDLVIPITIRTGDNAILTNALLDSTSESTYCSSSVIGGFSTDEPNSDWLRNGFKVESMDGVNYVNIFEPSFRENVDMPRICKLTHDTHRTEMNFTHPKLHPGGVGVVIGRNVPSVFQVFEIMKSNGKDIRASRCVLGWGLHDKTLNKLLK